MKIFRNIILASGLILASLNFTSCDLRQFGKDDKHGDGDAVVGFENAAYTYKESAGIVRLPVLITGSPINYPLTFDVKAEAIDLDDLSKLDDLIYFTQLNGLKFYDNGTVYVEFEVFDDADINADRTFKLTVTNPSGATLGSVAETVVTIRDNDNNPYEKLWGDWTFNATNASTGAAVSFAVNLSGGFTPEEEEANADKLLVAWGINNYKWSDHTPVWYIGYDADAGRLSIKVGTQMVAPGDVDWGLGGAQHCNMASYDTETNTISETVEISGTWSDDLKTLTFDPKLGIAAPIYSDGTYTGYVWFRMTNITMTR